MRSIPLSLGLAATTMVLVFAGPAHSQATRTWVSGVGDDVNPCSRTAPCKTFAGAISKTAMNGEINCLDRIIGGSMSDRWNGTVGAQVANSVYAKGCDDNEAIE